MGTKECEAHTLGVEVRPPLSTTAVTSFSVWASHEPATGGLVVLHRLSVVRSVNCLLSARYTMIANVHVPTALSVTSAALHVRMRTQMKDYDSALCTHLLVERNHGLRDILHCAGHGFVRPDCLQFQPNPLQMTPKLDELSHIIPCSHKVFREDLRPGESAACQM